MSDTVKPADDLDAAYASIRRQPYTFTWAGRDWTLCHFAELDYEMQAAIEGSADMDLAKLGELFRQAMGDAQADDWATVVRPIGLLEILFERWITYSGSKPGEDSASSSSSGSTTKSSRRTSGASTTSASPKSSTAKARTSKAVTRPVSSSA